MLSFNKLFTVALFVAISGPVIAGSSTACTRSDKKVLQAFGPTRLTCQPFGGDTGALYCAPGKCKAVPRGPEVPADFPGEITAHSVAPGGSAPLLHMQCNGISDTVCEFRGPDGAVAMEPSVPVETVVIPGDGCVYTSQEYNADHLTRRKFCWQSGALKEQAQPFSFVGFKSTAASILQLLEAPELTARVVHRIQPGSFVEILLANNRSNAFAKSDWILVRDSFGIVGWVSVESLGGDNSCLSGRPLGIKGFCQTGD